MAMWLWLYWSMKSIAAGKFKDVCLKTLDDVAATKTAIVITKRGRPVAKKVEKQQRTNGSAVTGTSSPSGSSPAPRASDYGSRTTDHAPRLTA